MGCTTLGLCCWDYEVKENTGNSYREVESVERELQG